VKCLLLTDDLVFGTQAAHTIRAAGYDVATLSDLDVVPSPVPDSVQLVVADLNMPQFDAPLMAQRLRSGRASPPALVAVGPHVHQAALQAARDAGWQVYTRGQFQSWGRP
jgi:DNA-binding response OmpR family regulator